MSSRQFESDYYPVYLGLWVNWSRGPVFGQTLTLTRSDGGFLIAFTALFVSFVGTRGWRILSFSLHRYFSSSSPQMAAYHQSQATLRNCDIQMSILQHMNLLWASFRSSLDSDTARKLNRSPLQIGRLTFILLLAIVYTVAFTVAGGFSSQISTAVGSEVLIQSLNCGWTSAALWDLDNSNHGTALVASAVSNSANYAQQCYSNDSVRVLDCGRLMTRNIPAQIDTQAPCPFLNDDVCLNNSGNLRIDSGHMDSLDDLGLNTPADGKIFLRHVAHCAPMKTQGYTSRRRMPASGISGKDVDLDDVTVYHYGNITTQTGVKDFMATARSIDSQYSYALSPDTTAYYANYYIFGVIARVDNGKIVTELSEFIPLDSIFPTDGDIFIVFLSGNGVTHTSPSDDEWYRVSPTPSTWTLLGSNDTAGQEQFYLPSEAASPLGCMMKYQYCIQDNKTCGILGGYAEAQNSPVAGIIETLGPTSLESQTGLYFGRQGPLPSNQWQRDVTRWFNIELANIQLSFLNAAYFNPTDTALLETRDYATGDENVFCQNQKIRSTGYTSFSLFGLLFTYISGFIIIAVSLLIEPLFWVLYKNFGYKPYATLEWTTNTTLQLQRLAHEGIGIGTWSRGTEKIPVTRSADLLGVIDMTAMSHPVLSSQVVREKHEASRNEKLKDGTHQM
ncbi:hypothetical protein F5Y18DRAFT_423478 [Xylariaceae sp. FL1019]|nr:hypothetical protein F5Y18DRAFT_423478 [Xylariaceae sp. FL1019]